MDELVTLALLIGGWRGSDTKAVSGCRGCIS
jgi:hypothetical protein